MYYQIHNNYRNIKINVDIDDKNNLENYIIVEYPCGAVVIGTDIKLLKVGGYIPNVVRNLKRMEYIPIVIYKDFGKIYKCPCCGNMSGTAAPMNPQVIWLFQHLPTCANAKKYPVEE
jgi:hypothetical protein